MEGNTSQQLHRNGMYSNSKCIRHGMKASKCPDPDERSDHNGTWDAKVILEVRNTLKKPKNKKLHTLRKETKKILLTVVTKKPEMDLSF